MDVFRKLFNSKGLQEGSVQGSTIPSNNKVNKQ
jgi:hypothetical protein